MRGTGHARDRLFGGDASLRLLKPTRRNEEPAPRLGWSELMFSELVNAGGRSQRIGFETGSVWVCA